MTESESHTDHAALSLQLMLFAIQLVVVYSLSHIVHHNKLLQKYLPEAAIAVCVGMCFSLLLKLMGLGDAITEFEPTVFFYGLLPPIIFAAGYHMRRKLFFRNWIAILSLAVVGTIISLCVVAMGLSLFIQRAPAFVKVEKSIDIFELVAFGALISSTDPVSTLSVFQSLNVDPNLFYIIFGESLLNDAIAITAFRSASKYVGQVGALQEALLGFFLDFCRCFFLSVIAGYFLGILGAVLFRYLSYEKIDQTHCIACLTCTILIPYYMSESIGLSGIVTILFSGIAARRYTKKNISVSAQESASALFTLSSSLAEVSCFLLLGLSVFCQHTLAHLSVGWVLASLLLCTVGRALSVYPLLGTINLFKLCRSTHYMRWHDSADQQPLSTAPSGSPTADLIPLKHMHMTFLAGLRGAVAFACANMFPDVNGNREVILSTTTMIILITLLLQGGMTETFIEWLKIPTGVDTKAYLEIIRMSDDNKRKEHATWLRSIKSSNSLYTSCISDSACGTSVLLASTHAEDHGNSSLAIVPQQAQKSLDWEQRFIYPLVLSDKAQRVFAQRSLTSANLNNHTTLLTVDSMRTAMNPDFPYDYNFHESLDTSGGGSYRIPHSDTTPRSELAWNTQERMETSATGNGDDTDILPESPLRDSSHRDNEGLLAAV